MEARVVGCCQLSPSGISADLCRYCGGYDLCFGEASAEYVPHVLYPRATSLGAMRLATLSLAPIIDIGEIPTLSLKS